MNTIRNQALSFILALGLSFALWAFVSFRENPNRVSDPFSLPLVVRGQAEDLVIVNQEGSQRTEFPSIGVTIETDQNTLAELSSSELQANLEAFVDLSGLGAGEHVVTVQTEIESPLDRRIETENVEPETITVRLDQEITRAVPVQIEVEGDPPFSFRRGNPQVNDQAPDEVTVAVSGPENRVEEVVIARATARIEGLSANYESSVQLQPLNANDQAVEGVTLDPATLNVEIPIRSVVGLKRLPVIGNVAGAPAPGYVITDIQSEPALINLTGSSETLETIEQVETAPVDITGITDTVTRTVPLNIPEGTSPQLGEPEEATITVRITPLEQRFQIELPFPVEVTGTPAGLNVNVDPQVVKVALSGPVEAFSQLDTETLVATLDLRGLAPGTYTRTPEISLPEAITVGSIPEVQVTLRSLPRPTVTRLPATPTAAPEPAPAATRTATKPPAATEPPTATAAPASPLPTEEPDPPQGAISTVVPEADITPLPIPIPTPDEIPASEETDAA